MLHRYIPRPTSHPADNLQQYKPRKPGNFFRVSANSVAKTSVQDSKFTLAALRDFRELRHPRVMEFEIQVVACSCREIQKRKPRLSEILQPSRVMVGLPWGGSKRVLQVESQRGWKPTPTSFNSLRIFS